MDTNFLVDTAIVVIYIVCLILEHYNLVPAGSETVVIGLLLGKAGGTLIANTTAGGGPKKDKDEQLISTAPARKALPDHA